MTERIMKSATVVLLFLILLISFGGCAGTEENGDGGLKIIATTFPGYDFARRICGDAAEVTLLIPPGSESHSYEPSAKDIAEISKCDLFIYTGGESDTWIEDIFASFDHKIERFSMMDCVELLENEGDEHSGHAHHHDHLGEYDEHVWTSPANAIQIAEGIGLKAVELSEDNKDDIKKNTEEYIAELTLLHSDFMELFDGIKGRQGELTLAIGDRFPLLYFTEEYGLDHISAFPGCSHETEVSAAQMSRIIDRIKAEGLKTVFYMDFSNPIIANSISEATGAEVKRLYSCHNVTKEQLEGGASYISLMRENLAVFTEAFN